jgi:hypothetical protein
MKVLFAMLCVTGMLLFPAHAQAGEGNDDLCQLGHKALPMTNEKADEFYENYIKGLRLKGKGSVQHIRQGGENKRTVVTVDCGNDVIVNVTTGDVIDVKIGQQVDFEGTSVSYGSMRYIYSRNTFLIFELDQGSVK